MAAQLARSTQQIGAIIRRHRQQRQLTQTELADLLGMRQATISVVESGKTGAKLSTLLAIIAVLDLELSIAPRSKSSAKNIEDIF